MFKMAADIKYQLKDFKGLSDGVLIPFEEKVKQELLCCTCNAASPMGLKDGKGHTFCLRCARVHTDSCNKFTCSLCGWQGQLNYMTTNTEEWGTLEQLAAACPNADTVCSYKGAFKDVLLHYKECGLRGKVECSLCGYLHDRKELADHMRDLCEKRVLECIFCHKDVEAWEKEKHEADCRERPASCEHCHQKFKTIAELEDQHYPQCGHMPVNCSFKSLGCGFVMLQKSLVEQEDKYKNSIDDVKALTTQLENTTNKALSNHTEFHARIKALEDNLLRQTLELQRRLDDVTDTLANWCPQSSCERVALAELSSSSSFSSSPGPFLRHRHLHKLSAAIPQVGYVEKQERLVNSCPGHGVKVQTHYQPWQYAQKYA